MNRLLLQAGNRCEAPCGPLRARRYWPGEPPAAPRLLNGEKAIVDEKIEALIGPEPVVDPAAAAALEARLRAEEDEISMRIAYYAIPLAAVFAFAFLFLLDPIFVWMGPSGQLLLWILVNIPLVAFALRAWRQARFPMGFGHAVQGYKGRFLAAALVLASLATFIEAGLAQELWQWVATPGW